MNGRGEDPPRAGPPLHRELEMELGLLSQQADGLLATAMAAE